MTRRHGMDDAGEPWRFPQRPGGPKKNLGPAAGVAPAALLHPLLKARLVADEFVVEAIEIAAVLAEEAVHPFLASRLEESFGGTSVVNLRFLDAPTLTSFRRTRTIVSRRNDSAWRLVRRWAGAGGDGGLDEAMCGVAAKYLNHEFRDLLRADVVTWIG